LAENVPFAGGSYLPNGERAVRGWGGLLLWKERETLEIR